MTVSGIGPVVAKVSVSIDGTACTTAAGATTVGLDHTFVSDLVITLGAPDGTEVRVINRAGETGQNFCNVLLDDNSAGPSIQGVRGSQAPFTGSYTPFESLSAFAGTSANGTWTLFAQDFSQPDVGSIRAWTLNITPAPPAASSTALTAMPNPSVFGQGVTFTASVTGSNPTGSVNFVADGSNPLCTAVPLTGGSAACTTNTLGAGNHTITASYSGDPGNTASAAALNQTVNRAATSVNATAPASAPVGQPFTVSATVAPTAPGAGTPGGSITASIGGGASCTITLPANSCSLTPTTAGNQTLTFNYAGDANFAASSTSGPITITQQTQTISFTSVPPASPQPGTSYTVAASATSGLPVTFMLDPSSTAGACSLSGATVSFLRAGSCVVAASQAGNGNVAPAPTATQSITVAPRTSSTTLSSSLNPSVFGADVILTASVGGSPTPTGSIDFIDSARPAMPLCAAVPLDTAGVARCTVSNLAVGSHAITAVYGGDANTTPSTSALVNQLVNKGATTSTVSAAMGAPGQPVSVTATVSVTAPARGTPTGSITVTTSSGAATCTITLPATSCSLTPTGTGSQTVTASYAGDANFAGSTSTASLNVALRTQTISFTSAPPASPQPGVSYTVAATATSGLPVSFALDPSSTAGACTLSGATVNFLRAGACVVAASQAGNGTFAPAPTVTQSSTVAPPVVPSRAQTISFTSTPPTAPVPGASYTLAATATSGLPVSFTLDPSSTAGACTLNGSTLRFEREGSCVVVASQAGNAAFDAAPTVTQRVTIATAAITAIPTLSEWMMLLLGGLIALLAVGRLRRSV